MTGGPTISVCLPTRNGAKTIERFLASFRPHVDEICVLDTGSTDQTLAILADHASRPGAPIIVEQAAWTGDYSAARNAADRLATSDFIIWSEDDEQLILGADTSLRGLVAAATPDLAFVRRIDVPSPDMVAAVFYQRIYPRSSAGRWIGRIHEHLGIDWDGATVVSPADLEVMHYPQPAAYRHQHRPLIESTFASEPTRRLQFFLGRDLLEEDGDYPAAAAALERVIAWDGGAYTRSEAWLIECSWHYLAHIRAELGDRWGARDAIAAKAEATAIKWRDPVRGKCERLGKQFPILDAHPVWGMIDAAGAGR